MICFHWSFQKWSVLYSVDVLCKIILSNILGSILETSLFLSNKLISFTHFLYFLAPKVRVLHRGELQPCIHIEWVLLTNTPAYHSLVLI